MAFQPTLEEARKNLQRVLQVLTEISLQGTVTLLPQDERADSLLADHERDLENLSALIRLEEDRLNPRWNKLYGEGGIDWEGDLNQTDGRSRGGIPYHCPRGWIRFSLNVCPDDEFERRFGSWGYLYHGTNSKHVGSILVSGFRASQGVYCGNDDGAVYMSPSIEYCGHPRYGCIEFNPETRQWLQIVLQCRVNPSAVWRTAPETLRCKEFGIDTIDPNVQNSGIEWLFRPERRAAGANYVKDAIICTGIMLRITDTHPSELQYWWSRDLAYLRAWSLDYPIVDPTMPLGPDWITVEETEMEHFDFDGSCLGDDFQLKPTKVSLGSSCMAPRPFGRGGMRFAYFLKTSEGMFAVKMYNGETLKRIRQDWKITEEEAVRKEVSTSLAATHFASKFNASLPQKRCGKSNQVSFLQPYIFRLRIRGQQRIMYGERYVEGEFIKWNNNAGFVNSDPAAEELKMHQMVGLFAHHTFVASEGRLMVVDIQGWQLGEEQNRKIIFTDPQVHTRVSVDNYRGDRMLCDRFSLGNLRRTGMIRFFKTHTCTSYCKMMGLPPAQEALEELRSVPSKKGARTGMGTALGTRSVPTPMGSRAAPMWTQPAPVTSRTQSGLVPKGTVSAAIPAGIGSAMPMSVRAAPMHPQTRSALGPAGILSAPMPMRSVLMPRRTRPASVPARTPAASSLGSGHRAVFLGDDSDVESGQEQGRWETPASGSLGPLASSACPARRKRKRRRKQKHHRLEKRRKENENENAGNARTGTRVTLIPRKLCRPL